MMKKIAITGVLFAALLWQTPEAAAQLKLPAASSAQEITQALGIGTVNIKYHRPNTRGRKVFGDLVPTGEVWRTGANAATVITFSSDVKIEGQDLPAGTYGLFTIPNENQWTIIFNKVSDQWGAYTYDESQDILRVNVPSEHLDHPVETFSIVFDDVMEQSLNIRLSWEKLGASFHVSTDQSKEILASIEEAMQGEKKPYFQAATYFFNHDMDIEKAAEWIKQADIGNDSAPHIKYWKSQILLKAGDQPGAIQAAEEGISMAESANNSEYIKLNTQALEKAKQ